MATVEATESATTTTTILGNEAALLKLCRKGSLDAIQVLLDQMDSPPIDSIADKNGWTSLHYATSGGQASVVKYLLSRGANMETTELTAMWTSVHVAAYVGCLSALVELLEVAEAGGRLKRVINCVDNHGSSPIILASLKSHKDVVVYLLQKGADLSLKTDKGKTALAVATAPDIIELLVAAGATDGVVVLPRRQTEQAAAASSSSSASPLNTSAATNDQSGDDVAQPSEPVAASVLQSVDTLGSLGKSGGGIDFAATGSQQGTASSPSSTTSTNPATAAATAATSTATPPPATSSRAAGPVDAVAEAEAVAKAQLAKEEAERTIIEFLKEGSWLLKHTKEGKGVVHRRYFKMDESGNLYWGHSPKGSNFKQAYITEVVPNCRPEHFKRNIEIFHDKELWKNTSFCLTSPLGLIHLVAETAELYKVWVAGVEIIVSRATSREYDLKKKGV